MKIKKTLYSKIKENTGLIRGKKSNKISLVKPVSNLKKLDKNSLSTYLDLTELEIDSRKINYGYFNEY